MFESYSKIKTTNVLDFDRFTKYVGELAALKVKEVINKRPAKVSFFGYLVNALLEGTDKHEKQLLKNIFTNHINSL